MTKPSKAPNADVVINPKKGLLAADFDAVLNEVRQAFVVIEQKLAGKSGGKLAALEKAGTRKPKALNKMLHLPQRVTLQLLRAYKWAISPLFPPACRYVPTCSEYAMEAVERYGAVRGGWMALTRLLRCHPFVRGGYDPVVKPRTDDQHPTAHTCHPAI